jgi:hypothetical protein
MSGLLVKCSRVFNRQTLQSSAILHGLPSSGVKRKAGANRPPFALIPSQAIGKGRGKLSYSSMNKPADGELVRVDFKGFAVIKKDCGGTAAVGK